MPWRLRGCERCRGDLYRYSRHQDFTCLQCGCDSRNGRAPSRRRRPKGPTGEDRLAAVYERFLAMVGVEDADEA